MNYTNKNKLFFYFININNRIKYYIYNKELYSNKILSVQFLIFVNPDKL